MEFFGVGMINQCKRCVILEGSNIFRKFHTPPDNQLVRPKSNEGSRGTSVIDKISNFPMVQV